MSRSSLMAWVLVFTAAANSARAADTLGVGVYLPTTLADGQARFALAEKLGERLTQSLKRPVKGQSFARLEDLARAVSSGAVSIVVADAWAGVHLSESMVPMALAKVSGEVSDRWVLAAPQNHGVPPLYQHKVAVPRGLAGAEWKLLSYLVFSGEVDAQKKFELVSVPNVESALTMTGAGAAEAVVVPLRQLSPSLQVVLQGPETPIAVVMTRRALIAGVRAAFTPVVSELAPFTGFASLEISEFNRFRALMAKGPPPLQPLLVPVSEVAPKAEDLLQPSVYRPALPPLLEMLHASSEKPDD